MILIRGRLWDKLIRDTIDRSGIDVLSPSEPSQLLSNPPRQVIDLPARGRADAAQTDQL